MRKTKKKKFRIIGLVFLMLVIVIATEAILSNTLIGISRYTIVSEQIPENFDGYTIVQIGDLHSKEFGEDHSYLLRKIEALDADIILLSGDMVNSWDTDFTVFYSLADQLAERYQVYYILGNHEQNLDPDNLQELLAHLDSIGISVLDNESVELKAGDDKLQLYGMWFNLRYYKDASNETQQDIYFGSDQINEVLGTADDTYQILLTHNPVYFETYADWGADLVLCGHLHGGMIRIPFLGGVFSPEIEIFPEYDAGRYEIGASVMLVNRGLGNGVLNFRWGNHPEISLITLRSQ